MIINKTKIKLIQKQEYQMLKIIIQINNKFKIQKKMTNKIKTINRKIKENLKKSIKKIMI